MSAKRRLALHPLERKISRERLCGRDVVVDNQYPYFGSAARHSARRPDCRTSVSMFVSHQPLLFWEITEHRACLTNFCLQEARLSVGFQRSYPPLASATQCGQRKGSRPCDQCGIRLARCECTLLRCKKQDV